MLIMFVANAQTVTKPQAQMRVDEYLIKITGLTTDTLGAVQTTINVPIYINKNDDVYFTSRLKLDSLSGSVAVPVILQAREFTSDAWTDLDTITFNGTQSDTTMAFYNRTTKTIYNHYNFKISRTDGKAKLREILFQVKK